MPSEKAQRKKNGASRIASSKLSETKQSELGVSSLNLSSLNKHRHTTETITDTADIVCLSHLRWHFVYQRPQHLLSRCVKGKRVFFIEEPIFNQENLRQLEISQDASGVVVVVPHLPEGLSEESVNANLQILIDGFLAEHNIHKYICWYYTPMAIAFTRHWQPQAVVYDCMDELSGFQGAPPTLKNYEAELFRRADLVFTGGQSLYENKVNQHPNVYAFPSSVDITHFGEARNLETEPADQAHIPHPRLGFFGVIDERMDIELLQGIADARPDWHLVMVGPVVKIDPAMLPQSENIHYLGVKTYQQLPEYLAGWDLAMLPFARNEATRFISPTKTPEYLAAGKPVVSTSIRDVVRPYGESKLVRIADTVSDFITAAEKAMQEDTPKSGWLSRVDAFLEQISWDRTWASMIKLIDSAIATSTPRSAIATRDAEEKNNLGAIAKKQAPNIITRDFVFDYLIVGAGFSGSVIAERLATQLGKKVLVVDKRNHIGGNAYDHYNDHGILVHKYGPHIFHTNSREIFEYLSRFTQWRSYEHRVLASVDGQLVPIPINLDTINTLYGMDLNSFEVEDFFKALAEPKEYIYTSEDVVVSKVGRVLYEKFFRGYTRKQWGLDPSELDKSVIARIPTRNNRDNRYFTDTYQSMPLHGFTRLFENMLNHPNIKVMLNTDYQEIEKAIPCREMVYTGPVDDFFDYRYGKLPYRSLDFQHETHNIPVFQPVPVINYPNEHLYTRVTEFKYLTGQEHAKTSIVYEFPKAEGDPYYPVPRPENQEIYKKYKALADATPEVYFVGRLATYKYYNMDQCVGQALSVYKQIAVKV
ncbi:UDP-galactopyranose mutase [Anabaena cylindrica FACHB-243]|uniref:UDP-galactopyranose mutase n=1 Tax=Anabaena cylindrica (strain ATCC 27899 / PCC 7122) TaxID=272123 RepID=K9ZF99_ANACC|nr:MULTISPECIES: UDP-galactopyranose mutase [Anabaena]AFZ57424.1 UDP-galactopyranose mutase [Anabaena cylindrica PCC 7122]MBD2421104.1 UDP-galactopyranose mutase [Anabaena cylindrica FACHB-243]MBY5284108.1 UDP-galactopyranose mutase [Anabaena sp. CCAP 1446/1C]MBY5310678.1 UDP-galactopyranose mutase [Anabaena sp. CCAP 1446/1C]MCM2405859.1 UDP-galactopyranose mutase [Anabaena sp. CCAP 1446/1C]